MSKLHKKKCLACTTGTPPLSAQESNELLGQLHANWQLSTNGHLICHFGFNDFISALHFTNQVGIIAEAEGHHPNILLTWGNCQVEIWTHKIDGLSESDFVLAAKIDQLRA